MGRHALRRRSLWARLTHHPRVARWVATRDRLVLGAVATVIGLAVLVGCTGGSAPPRQLDPGYGEVGSGW